MPTPTPTPTQDPADIPPAEFFQRENWLYDLLMGQIEPDLTTAEIGQLDERYRGETPEQRKERHAHYDRAFEVFGEAFEHLSDTLQKDFHAVQEKVREQRLAEEKKEHDADLHEADSKLNTDQ